MVNVFWYNTMQILRLIFLTIIICHISSLIYWYLGTYEEKYNSSDDNWLRAYEIENETWNKIYLEAFYYQLTTISTVGYGDYLPVSNKEKVFILFSMMFSSAVFAYVLTCFGEILQELNRQKLQQKKDVLFMNMILDKKGTNPSFKAKAINYIVFKNKHIDQLGVEEEQEYLNELPVYLKNQIILESNMRILGKFKIFQYFSPQSQELIAQKIKEERFQERDIIFLQNQEDNNQEITDSFNSFKIKNIQVYKEKIYFVQQGSVSQISAIKNLNNITQHDKEIIQYDKGDIFDNLFFNQKLQIPQNIQAMTNCTLYSISQKDFIQSIKGQSKDYEIYREMVDQIQFTYSKKNHEIQYCNQCKKYHHTIQQCKYLHYQPEKTKIILHANKTEFQKRQKFDRRDRGFFQCLIYNQMVQQIAMDIQDDYISEESSSMEPSSYDQSDASQSNNTIQESPNIQAMQTSEKRRSVRHKSVVRQTMFNDLNGNNNEKHISNLANFSISIHEVNKNNGLGNSYTNNNNNNNNNGIGSSHKFGGASGMTTQHYQTNKQMNQNKKKMEIQNDNKNYKLNNIQQQYQMQQLQLQQKNQIHQKNSNFNQNNNQNNNSNLHSNNLRVTPQQLNRRGSLFIDSKDISTMNSNIYQTHKIFQEYQYYENEDIDAPFNYKTYNNNENLCLKELAIKIQHYQKLDKNFGIYTYFNYKKYQLTQQDNESNLMMNSHQFKVKKRSTSVLQSMQMKNKLLFKMPTISHDECSQYSSPNHQNQIHNNKDSKENNLYAEFGEFYDKSERYIKDNVSQ